MPGHLCPSMACAMSGHGAGIVGAWPQRGLNVLTPSSPQEPPMPATIPDLAETARRVARQLTALSDELLEAAPEPASGHAAYLYLPEGLEMSPGRLGDLQHALRQATAFMRLPVTVIVLPPGAMPFGISEPDVRNYGLKERNT